MPVPTDPGKRLIRAKTSASVVDYFLEEIFAGRLKPGDRIDLDEAGEILGVSRIPVREAMVVLERDGIVSSQYHRGYYVGPFDAESLMDDFEIFGQLSGVALRRLAERPDPAVIADLAALVDELAAADPADRDRVFELVSRIVTTEHRAGGSRRLRAELRALSGYLPQSLRVGTGRSHDVTVAAHRRVLRAVRAGDGEKAARYRLEDFRAAGRDVIRELERRGVLTRAPGTRRG